MAIDTTKEDLLTPEEAASRWGLKPGTVYGYAAQGWRGIRLETVRVGGALRTTVAAMDRFTQACTAEREARRGAAS